MSTADPVPATRATVPTSKPPTLSLEACCDEVRRKFCRLSTPRAADIARQRQAGAVLPRSPCRARTRACHICTASLVIFVKQSSLEDDKGHTRGTDTGLDPTTRSSSSLSEEERVANGPSVKARMRGYVGSRVVRHREAPPIFASFLETCKNQWPWRCFNIRQADRDKRGPTWLVVSETVVYVVRVRKKGRHVG
jgi:hypothetical protein